MKALYASLSCLAVATVAWGQAEVPPKKPASVVECRTCHTSDAPTTENPSLVQCPRAMTRGVHAPAEAPDDITLGRSEGPYGPVEFSHKAHAEMSEMGGGCYQCHHYDQGGRIQKCEACHSAERARADVAVPDRAGAVHRLCVECHRQWSHSTDCATCHGKKELPRARSAQRVIYETSYEEAPVVTFLHEEHVTRFALTCADCHQQQSCVSCHDPFKDAVNDAEAALPVEDHKACSSCHANDDCVPCHSTQPIETFDHGRSTGWIHNRFHAGLDCESCHTTPGKFTEIDTECDSCHPDWQETFDHQKVGIVFSEDHTGLDCGLCHADEAFVAPPVCSDCHDDRSYPQDKPGETAGETGKQ